MADSYTNRKHCPACHSVIQSCKCLSDVGERLAVAGERIAEACNELARLSLNLQNAMRPIVGVVTQVAERFEAKVQNERMNTMAKRLSKLRCRSYWRRLIEDDFIG